jgi:hypothetical protein
MTWFKKRKHPPDSAESRQSAEEFMRGSKLRRHRLDENLSREGTGRGLAGGGGGCEAISGA